MIACCLRFYCLLVGGRTRRSLHQPALHCHWFCSGSACSVSPVLWFVIVDMCFSAAARCYKGLLLCTPSAMVTALLNATLFRTRTPSCASESMHNGLAVGMCLLIACCLSLCGEVIQDHHLGGEYAICASYAMWGQIPCLSDADGALLFAEFKQYPWCWCLCTARVWCSVQCNSHRLKLGNCRAFTLHVLQQHQ